MQRRDFIVLAATGTAATLTLEGCSKPGDYGTPLYIANSEYVPGVDYWHATGCHECSAGCGLIIRKRDGKVNKVDGNPLHPISAGKSCARAQAALNRLYNPDRLKNPLKRKGARDSGEFDPVSWDEAIDTVSTRISELIAQGKGGRILWLNDDHREGALQSLIERLMKACGSANVVSCNPFSREVERAAAESSFGTGSLQRVDLSKADCVVSFGARFLETWDSPVLHARGLGVMRSAGPGKHCFIHAEPRMSMTAANADIWLPVRPGGEGMLALAIAAEILKLDGKESPFELDKQIRDSIGVADEKISRVAKELKESKSPVIVAGESAAAHRTGRFNLEAINYLSSIASGARSQGPGVTGQEPGVRDQGPVALTQLLQETQLLLLRNANPVYTTPPSFKLREAINAIPFIVSFSSVIDETTALADLVLPDNSPYENWDASGSAGIVTISKPVIEPLYDARPSGDVLLAIARKVPALAEHAKSETFMDLVRESHLSNPNSDDADSRWEEIILRGGLWQPEAAIPSSPQVPSLKPPQIEREPDDLNAKEYPFHFLPYEHMTLGSGGQANLPLAQELPDPMTSVSWSSWVELNPETAHNLGVAAGDVLSIESPAGRIEAPVVIFPGIRPDTVAMPCGQGHESLGRYAQRRGVNALSILLPLTELKTGQLAWAATRVKLTPTGRKVRLAATGTNERLLEDRQFLR